MLDKQIDLYSVDTGHFYSNNERYYHDMNCRYRRERNYVKNHLDTLKEEYLKEHTEEELNQYKTYEIVNISSTLKKSTDPLEIYACYQCIISHKRAKAQESKNKLLHKLSERMRKNETGKDHIRTLREEELKDVNVISVFSSSLTRTIGAKIDEFTEDLMVVQVYYFDVFKDLCFNGYLYKGEKYIYYTSSAGQIRKKKAVFIKESVWLKHERTIMCGLTTDKINEKGGNNVNKHLAYLALNNSATEPWEDFDIDKTIVVDDFETDVLGVYDFIDDNDYSITRKEGYVPIPHMDGSGLILPRVSSKNSMVRLPWIKGLLGVFDYVSLIEEKGWSPTIVDVYGKEHNVIEEEIEIIFTKSQFKMWKYYDSWEQYKEYFKEYKCTAGRCNIEEDRIKNAKINYQMLQTLTDITDEEINELCDKSTSKIKNICQSQKTMMDVLGVTPYNTNMSAFQKSVKMYPSLLSDTYSKDVIREVKNSLLKKYRSGKLEVSGKYTFLLPDFYAFCEWLFGHVEEPVGLLADKEVYCRLFFYADKVDCLRSPHLYKEHAVRTNVAYKENEKRKEISKWFITDGIYTSTHDLISKILQFDVDGDKSLVVADKKFVEIAERNMEGIVPLYYNMRKASPTELNSKNIYRGLNDAFVGGNIGIYSNDISKIWNDDVFITGTEEEKTDAINAVKLLCMENNFVIDYAKTLYKPVRPRDKDALITKYTHKKLPAFFEFAKDKELSQVEPRNDSFVNKIYKRIIDTPINTRKMDMEKFDYTKLMSNVNVECDKSVQDIYEQMSKVYRYKINMKDEYIDNLSHVAKIIREEFAKTGYDEETITNMLVSYLYGKKKKRKQVLWFAYGNQIMNNISKNIKIKRTKFIQCIECGEWVEVNASSKRIDRCENCYKEHRKNKVRENVKKFRENNM